MASTSEPRDIGDLLAVPADERLDVDDQDPAELALAGGADDDLADVYADPDGHS